MWLDANETNHSHHVWCEVVEYCLEKCGWYWGERAGHMVCVNQCHQFLRGMTVSKIRECQQTSELVRHWVSRKRDCWAGKKKINKEEILENNLHGPEMHLLIFEWEKAILNVATEEEKEASNTCYLARSVGRLDFIHFFFYTSKHCSFNPENVRSAGFAGVGRAGFEVRGQWEHKVEAVLSVGRSEKRRAWW